MASLRLRVFVEMVTRRRGGIQCRGKSVGAQLYGLLHHRLRQVCSDHPSLLHTQAQAVGLFGVTDSFHAYYFHTHTLS